MKMAVGSLVLALCLLLATGMASAVEDEASLVPVSLSVAPMTVYMPACESIDGSGIYGFFAASNLAAARASCVSFEAALRQGLHGVSGYVFAPGYSAKDYPVIDSVPVDGALEARAGSRYRLVVGVPALQRNAPGKYLPVAYRWRMAQDFRVARIADALAKAVHYAGMSGSPVDAGKAWGLAMAKGLIGPRCGPAPDAAGSFMTSTRMQAIADWHCDSFAL